MAGRPRRWLVVLAATVVLVVGAVTWTSVRDDPYVAPPPSLSQPRAQPAAAARTLEALAAAVATGDRAAARALAPDDDPSSRRLLGELVSNAEDLGIDDLSLRYVDEAGGVSADGAWSAAVDARWRLEVETRPSEAEISVGLVADDDRVAVASLGGGGRRTPVWLTGRVEVRRTGETLVIDRAGEADRVARLARSAVTVVRRVLPRWRSVLVVEVPATADDLDEALGAEEGRYAAVAAVTASADGSSGAGAPVHVFVNPEVLGDLGTVGAHVVMSHEAAHVALGADRSAMPLWLLEGFADYVALRDVDLPATRIAAQAIEQVRRHGVPEALPGAAEFDTRGPHLGAAYESAWLACVVLADAAGERPLVALYRALDAGETTDGALRRLFGFGERELVRRWQERLSDLAR